MTDPTDARRERIAELRRPSFRIEPLRDELANALERIDALEKALREVVNAFEYGNYIPKQLRTKVRAALTRSASHDPLEKSHSRIRHSG